MARFKTIEILKSLSGKVCEHSDMYFANRYGTNYTGKICNPRNLEKDPYSAEELAARTKFTAAQAAVKALSSEQKTAYATAFANQKKYKSLQGYMFAQEYAKLA